MPRALAFLFDLDGVVIDSMALHTESWILYLQQQGLSADRLQERMHGRRNDEIVRDLFGAGLTEADVYRHGAAKEALFRRLMEPRLEASLVPGLRGFLARFDSVPTGLVSNAEPANIDFVLDGAGLRPFFDVVVDGHQVERPKPHPDMYVLAARNLGFRPEDCVIFEDSPAGLAAARASGGRVVAVNAPGADLPAALHVRDFQQPELMAWLATQLA